MKNNTDFFLTKQFKMWSAVSAIYFAYYFLSDINSTDLYNHGTGIAFLMIKFLGILALLPFRQEKIKILAFSFLGIAYFFESYFAFVVAPQSLILCLTFLASFVYFSLKPDEQISKDYLHFLKVVIVLTHFTAGYSKLTSGDINWLTGNAIELILRTSAWVNPGVAEGALSLMPKSLLILASHSAIAIELSSVFMLLKSKWVSRTAIYALILLHLGSAVVFIIPEVNLGIVIVLVYIELFNSWLQKD